MSVGRGQKNIVSLAVVTVNSVSNNRPVSFVILAKMWESSSSSIYKCLHPATGWIYCLKKCVVTKDNLHQLIVEHKVATYLDHPNLVRGFASFYDRTSLYLLMEYME